ncbi:hypothetical protein FNV43_RR05980 [Rhamnella rubrinervis]|uniref:Peptidase S26 domain-containing protein n=1 Tax=Rhamnella rubrinervis TaxID=2594499 RepID=A0A8K0MKW6_9ROSA|nr:hypothetical protein FNV43_RR05980 [Rhamnella rubrinervis]
MVLGNLREILYVMKEKSVVREAWDKTLVLAKFLCGLRVTNTYLCTVVVPYGPSMLPTLSLTGDLLLAERISTRFDMVRRGDIVLVRSPEVPRKVVTKRLIGMEGDSVSYVVDPQNSDRCETIVVPKGHVWVEGDNVYVSNDSRKFGPVPYGLIEAKVLWRAKGIDLGVLVYAIPINDHFLLSHSTKGKIDKAARTLELKLMDVLAEMSSKEEKILNDEVAAVVGPIKHAEIRCFLEWKVTLCTNIILNMATQGFWITGTKENEGCSGIRRVFCGRGLEDLAETLKFW